MGLTLLFISIILILGETKNDYIKQSRNDKLSTLQEKRSCT